MRISVISKIKTVVYISHSEKDSIDILSTYICQTIHNAGAENKFHQAKKIAKILARFVFKKRKNAIMIVIKPITIE